MERETILITCTVVSACSASLMCLWKLLDTWHTIRVHNATARDTSPLVQVIHHYKSIVGPDKPFDHRLEIDIANRDEHPIAVRQINWYFKGASSCWDAAYTSQHGDTSENIYQRKLETSDLLKLEIDIKDVFALRCRMTPLDIALTLRSLRLGIQFTNGEFAERTLRSSFRRMLFDQYVAPSWIRALLRQFV